MKKYYILFAIVMFLIAGLVIAQEKATTTQETKKETTTCAKHVMKADTAKNCCEQMSSESSEDCQHKCQGKEKMKEAECYHPKAHHGSGAATKTQPPVKEQPKEAPKSK